LRENRLFLFGRLHLRIPLALTDVLPGGTGEPFTHSGGSSRLAIEQHLGEG